MILLFIAIGLGAGMLSGVFGIGGGIVIVPALIYLAKMTPQQAAGMRIDRFHGSPSASSRFWTALS